MKIQFNQSVTVDGTPYKAGQEVDLDAIPKGSQPCVVRFFASECAEPKPEPEPEEKAKPAPKKPAPRKRTQKEK